MGDLSRWSFDPLRDYSDVLSQQGRVDTESDRNEATSIVARRTQAGTLDTIGRAAVPRETPDGFRIDVPAGKITIGYGRIYVDGILAENHESASGTFDPHLAEISGAQHAGGTAVPGLAFEAQPYVPFLALGTRPDGFAIPAAGARALAYLKVWKRDVTAVEDPGLIEKALGVDTTTRLQTVWQVRLLENLDANVACDTPLDSVPNFTALEPPAGGRLTSKLLEIDGATTPCEMPIADGYRGLENQLYRVEIHTGGRSNATFKWSRDNASLGSRIEKVTSGTEIVVESLGRDETMSFREGDWVEITDDGRELQGKAGDLRRVIAGGVNRVTRTLTLENAITTADFQEGQRNLRVRRWDQRGMVRHETPTGLADDFDLDAAGASGEIPVPVAGRFVLLENNIAVSFDLAGADGAYRPGDYWLIWARTVDASIDVLTKAPPLGIHAHYTKLGLVTLPGTVVDCRTLWPPEGGNDCCDCTVCVTEVEQRNDPRAIQNAIASLHEKGGTVCLGPGDFLIRDPLEIRNDNLRIRGHGPATRLAGANAGPLFTLDGATSVVLEGFSCSSTLKLTESLITISNSADVALDRLELLAQGPQENFAGNAISLLGALPDVRVTRCRIKSGRGVLAGSVSKDQQGVIDLRVVDNHFECGDAAIEFGRATFHEGVTVIQGNTVMGCASVGIAVTGTALRGGMVHISDNWLEVIGSGIEIGADNFLIAGNEIHGADERGQDGIVIRRGLRAQEIDTARVMGNHVFDMNGEGVAIRAPILSGMFKANVLERLGGSGITMHGADECGDLVIENNQLIDVGRKESTNGWAVGLSFAGVRDLDVRSNAITILSRNARQASGCAGILAVGCERVRIDSNHLSGIGPLDDRQPRITGVLVEAPFHEVVVEANSIRRRATESENLRGGAWAGIEVLGATKFEAIAGVPVTTRPAFHAIANYAVWTLPNRSVRPAVDRLLVFTGGRVMARPIPDDPTVAVLGNLVEAQLSTLPALLIAGVGGCRVQANHFQSLNTPENAIHASHIQAQYAIVASNEWRGPVADKEVTILRIDVAAGSSPGIGTFTVVGNLANGRIQLGNAELPGIWRELNPFCPI
jgi:uncharacterized protein DUF6519